MQMMAELLESKQTPMALQWRKRALEAAPNAENKLLLVSSALRFNDLAQATNVFNQIAKSERQGMTYHSVAAQMAIKMGNQSVAIQHIKALTEAEPDNPLHRLNLAVLYATSDKSSDIKTGQTMLEELAAHPKIGTDAVRSLVADGLNHRDLARALEFSRKLISTTNAVFSDKLQHLGILWENPRPFDGRTNLFPQPFAAEQRGKSAEFKTYLAGVQKEGAEKAATATALMEWMNSHELTAEALTWANTLSAQLRKQAPLPLVTANCYLALKNWAGLERYLDTGKWDDQDFVRSALLSLCAREQHASEIANSYWQQAKRNASERAENLGLLLQLTRVWGWTRESEEVLRLSAERFPDEKWPLQSLTRTYMLQGDTVRALGAVKDLLSADKQNAVAKNDLAMVCMLLNKDLDKAHQLAKEVYELDPKNFGFVSTYAYSLHLQGKTAEALQLMQTLRAEELKIPAVAAYYGVFLAAAGQKEKAAQYLKLSDSAVLLPEEKKLVAAAKAGVN
jgi:tetratricopeptide (TPR) repeat protein